jgi:hypothetical protein
MDSCLDTQQPVKQSAPHCSLPALDYFLTVGVNTDFVFHVNSSIPERIFISLPLQHGRQKTLHFQKTFFQKGGHPISDARQGALSLDFSTESVKGSSN